MELPQQELQALGRTVALTFKRLVEALWTEDQRTGISTGRRIAVEEERFQLWARTLGLFQTGHASLDYRVRDASFIRASLADLLTELQDHLQNLLDITLGTRPPLELDKKVHQEGGTQDDGNFSDDETSLASSQSSIGSFQEADFRLSTAATRLDSLYKLASRIRSPRNRQQRPTEDLYKHIPESQRAEYIQNQELIEISLVAYVQEQQLREWVNDEDLQELDFDREELISQYISSNHWLVARAGRANARRKQQFLYWKKHAQLLGRNVTEEAPAVAKLPVDAIALPKPTMTPSHASKPAFAKSIATSVTKADLTMMGPEDMRSVISHRSRVSTVASPRGEDLAWPPAPSHLVGHLYFPCPYCGVLCPDRYLSGDDWHIHQVHDLQPYHCTYEDCSDPDRLYGVKQEWIDHENQHRRVWHCHSHEAEFETQPEYLQHLREQHPENKLEDYTSEMIAAVVGASAKPLRDCPFCPTTFSDVTIMRKHVRYHLERLALYALPDVTEDKSGELASENSADSHQVIEHRGRRDSIGNDFAEGRQAFLAEFSEDKIDHIGPMEGRALISKANLQRTQFSSTMSLLNTYLASQHPASPKSEDYTVGWVDAIESSVEKYTVGWICASTTEYVAAQLFLDEKHERPAWVPKNDENDYTLGKIGKHNVVIATTPEGEDGPISTASVARDMLRTFTAIRIGLIVGVGGGVPSQKHDIRLGDVVVSASRGGKGGVFQYNFRKSEISEQIHDTGFLNIPPMALRVAMTGLKAIYEVDGHQIQEHITKILEEKPKLNRMYSRPDLSTDKLFVATITHESVCATSCSDDPTSLIARGERTDSEDDPAIHFGLIASADQLMSDAVLRDKLASERDIICFETEAVGLSNHFPCLVIRGICDYSDSHKNKQWQGYAAMTAAAYTKDLLNLISPAKVAAEEKIAAVFEVASGGDNRRMLPAPVQLRNGFWEE